jgi:hypothetical protein
MNFTLHQIEGNGLCGFQAVCIFFNRENIELPAMYTPGGLKIRIDDAEAGDKTMLLCRIQDLTAGI